MSQVHYVVHHCPLTIKRLSLLLQKKNSNAFIFHARPLVLTHRCMLSYIKIIFSWEATKRQYTLKRNSFDLLVWCTLVKDCCNLIYCFFCWIMILFTFACFLLCLLEYLFGTCIFNFVILFLFLDSSVVIIIFLYFFKSLNVRSYKFLLIVCRYKVLFLQF